MKITISSLLPLLSSQDQTIKSNVRMSNKKIIAVIGSTGSQGGSVVDIFLNDPVLNKEWAVHTITRDLSKEKAKKLVERGAKAVAVSHR